MSPRALLRTFLAVGIVSIAASCGDSTTDPVFPTDPSTLLTTTRSGDVVEALVTIKSNGTSDGTTGDYPPSFSLSTVPGSVQANHALSASGIPVDPYQPFAPSMAADYGDGTGAHGVSVSQSGGVLVMNPDGTVTQSPASYSFKLAHTYAAPGTYTITVLAETYGDYPSSRVMTKSVSVTQDLSIYLKNFQITSPVKSGVRADYSVDVSGPPADDYDITVDYGTNLIEHRTAAPGTTLSANYTWKDGGTYTMKITASNGSTSATLTRTIEVEQTHPTLTDLVVTPELQQGDTAHYSFTVASDGGSFPVKIEFGDGTDDRTLNATAGLTITGKHVYDSGHFVFRVTATDPDGTNPVYAAAPVSVYRPEPKLLDVSIPDTVYVGEPFHIGFTSTDPTPMPDLADPAQYDPNLYKAWILLLTQAPTQLQGQHIFSEDTLVTDTTVTVNSVGAWHVHIVMGSSKNNLIEVDSVSADIIAVVRVCQPGTYRTADGCVDAPVGTYTDQEDAPAATSCPTGQYQDATGQSSCKDAPEGFYVDQVGAAQATACAVGRYQDQTGQTSCLPAEPGSFVAVTGSAQTTPCPAGTYQPAEGSASCLSAPAGSFVSGTGATQAELCPAGTFSSQPGSESCEPAPAGSYVSGVGQTQATQCPAGTYQDQAGQNSCKDAPAGRFVSTIGASQATPCSAGSYQPSPGSTSCLPADPGHFVALSAASTQTACVVGTYQPDAGRTSCLVAPIGRYVDVTGASAATACPAGTSTLAVGSASASDCLTVGDIAVVHIDEAVQSGGLAPAAGGKSGENQFNAWITDVNRAVGFLSGPQKQAGCVQLRNAIAKAGGPKPVVTGSSVAQVVADLQGVMEQNGCSVK